MEKEELRERLMCVLRKMYKMDIIVQLMEFVEGETAVLGCLTRHEGPMNPSQLSEEMHISRARTANILRALRRKGRIRMEIDDDDRRKMHVEATAEGRAFYEKKLAFLGRYFDGYIGVLGEEDTRALIGLLDKTVESEAVLRQKGVLREERT